MIPLFQLFEFSYLDGLLFYDRSGTLSRRLQERFPGLAFKGSVLDQRDFVLPAEDLELFFGITLSHIQTLNPSQPEFPSIAAGFLRIVTEVLELSQLHSFHFRYVLGKPCESDEEAQRRMALKLDLRLSCPVVYDEAGGGGSRRSLGGKVAAFAVASPGPFASSGWLGAKPHTALGRGPRSPFWP